MATLHSVDISSGQKRINSMESILTSKGLITQVLFKDSSNLIFSTPLTNKIVKIVISANYTNDFTLDIGDSWTSGTTITNPVNITRISSSESTLESSSIIADSEYMIIVNRCVVSEYGNTIAYIGKLDNGEVLAFGLAVSSSSSGNMAYLPATGKFLNMLTFGTIDAKDDLGNFVTMPLMFASKNDNVLCMNGTNPAAAVGIKTASVGNSLGKSIFVGYGYILTPSNMNMNKVRAIYSSLCIEYTP